MQESCENGDVRLSGGFNPLEGRVEVCFNSAWGTICNNLFSLSDVNVVCTQLGYRLNGTELLPISEFSQGTGPIFLDELACDGDEERILDCGGNAPGLHTCTHSQDVAIRCIGEYLKWIKLYKLMLKVTGKILCVKCRASTNGMIGMAITYWFQGR